MKLYTKGVYEIINPWTIIVYFVRIILLVYAIIGLLLRYMLRMGMYV